MSPVLHYFGIPARGEATRVALAMAGVDFVDKRMAFEDLPACRFKTVPVYEVSKKDTQRGEFTSSAVVQGVSLFS